MASVSAADTWREAGGRSDRSAGRPDASRGGRPLPGQRAPLPPLPPLPSHGRSAAPAQRPAAAPQRPAAEDRRPAGQGRPVQRPAVPPAGQARPVQRPPAPREQASYGRETPGYPRRSAGLGPENPHRSARPDLDDSGRIGAAPRGTSRAVAAPAPEQGSRLRGSLAVLGVLLVTLAAGYVDALGTTGMGMITLLGLTGSTALATLLVRRRDLMSLVVAPPLVLLGVVCVYVVTAPSFDVAEGRNPVVVAGTAVASKLVLGGGFPIMAAATGTALVVALIRWAARR